MQNGKLPRFPNITQLHRKNPAIGNGVKVTSVKEDTETDFVKEYDPSNPDADADGYVSYPNVNTVTEMTNLIDSTRAYEANATAFDATKSMATTGLSIRKTIIKSKLYERGQKHGYHTIVWSFF